MAEASLRPALSQPASLIGPHHQPVQPSKELSCHFGEFTVLENQKRIVSPAKP